MVERVDAATNAASDYERIGGGSAVSGVVDKFYERVLADPPLASTFAGIDMNRLKRHQVQLISHVLGGPVAYEGRGLREAHAGFDIGDDDFNRVVAHLVAVLEEAQVDSDIIERVGAELAGVKDDIVNSGA